MLVDDQGYFLPEETTKEQSIFCLHILMRFFFAGGDIPSEIKRSIVVRVEISREVLFLNS